MVKPTPDPPVINLSTDHPLFHFPSDLSGKNGHALAEHFRCQRALMEQARRNAQCSSQPSRRFWQFWWR